MSADYDDLVIGAGMAGLTVTSLLAARGRRVLVVEAHDTPGGYAHTFQVGQHRFCAQVHYVFGCGEGEPIHELLRRLGLNESVRFHRLDPEGYDHIVVAGERHRIPNGLDKFRDRLIARYPNDARPIRRYFEVVGAIGRELDVMPQTIAWRDLLMAPLRFPNLLRYRLATLRDLYDRIEMPPRLRAVLAGQSGDYLLPPAEVSLLLHVALVRAYDRGAYYPEKHYRHFILSIADFIRAQPGCALMLETEIDRIFMDDRGVAGVRAKSGEVFTATRYVSNLDPRRTAALMGSHPLPRRWRKTLDYEYSSGTHTLYLAVRDIDLRDYGFGSHNVWHYPHDDIDAMYRRQARDHDFSDPWLFMSTPTLHTSEPGLCPPGQQVLEIATSADHAHFSSLRARDRRAYNRTKKQIRDQLLSVIERHYVPRLREHLAVVVMGTPATNERFCFAPEGNAYGSALTPENVGRGRIGHDTPWTNLFLVNATAGFPSIGATVRAGMDLAAKL